MDSNLDNALKNLVNQEFDFYGACNNQFKLDDTIYEALEDESDGYRSYLKSIKVADSKEIFFKTPIARVKISCASHDVTLVGDIFDPDGYDLIDVKDGHVWLTVGTDYSDSYYPQFIFRYQAKPQVPTMKLSVPAHEILNILSGIELRPKMYGLSLDSVEGIYYTLLCLLFGNEFVRVAFNKETETLAGFKTSAALHTYIKTFPKLIKSLKNVRKELCKNI